MELLINFLRYTSLFSPVFFFIVLFHIRKHQFIKTDIIVVVIVILSFSTDITLKYIIDGKNYIYMFIYLLIETALLIYFYHNILKKSRILILVMLLTFLITLIYELLIKNPVDDFFTLTFTIRCLIFIIFSLYYFYQIYNREEDIFKSKASQFWYNVSIIIYFSLAFFPFLLATEILSGLFDYSLWQVHNIGNILKNIIFAIGLWMVQKR